MKKLVILGIMLVVLGFVSVLNVNAEEYLNYQEIVFDDDDAYLLDDYTEEDYDDAYKLLSKRKFMGWRIVIVNDQEELEFISETKLKIYNNGFSTIQHDITLETEETVKYQLSVTGGIKLSGDGNVKKFKGSIDADIKSSVSYNKTTNSSEKYVFEIIVDPLTYVSIVTRGKGEINNGVGIKYFFWIKTSKGGWETFNQTTEYYEIVKDRI